MKTRQSPYDLARLLDEYPQVFDAYLVQVDGLSEGNHKNFFAQREATRAERIRKAVGRR